MSAPGVFFDVVGLSYSSGELKGEVASDYSFSYTPNVPITFSIGGLVVATTVARSSMTVSDLFPSKDPVNEPSLINRARLLYSLAPGLGFEKPVVIDDKVRETVSKYAAEIHLDSPSLTSLDDTLSKICSELHLIPKSVSHTRNHLRRAAAGFRVLRDLKIPTKDGNYVLGDVYLPFAQKKKFPVLASCTLYGKRVVASGPELENKISIDQFEKYEDDWHSTTTDVELFLPNSENWFSTWTHQRGFENIATFNSYSYVPHGYAMLRIDPRGVSQTPGTRSVPGQMPSDFADAIEWAVQQSWSDGGAAMVGSSAGANSQWRTALLKPNGLKCFVPYAGDVDTYREAAYIGGVPSTRFINDWTQRIRRVSPKWKDSMDVYKIISMQKFDNHLYEMMSAGPQDDGLPCFLAGAQNFLIHGRGAYESFKLRDPTITHLQLVDCNYYPWPSHTSSGKILQFLDKYLKGIDTSLETVAIQIRLGNKCWIWRTEESWPVPGTTYLRWHLQGDGSLTTTPSADSPKALSYSSKVKLNGAKSGISFLSAPLESDTDFAGHFMARLNISSTLEDADVVVSLWAIDENDNVVRYSSKGKPEPVAKGLLRVSHRKLDTEKTLPERPYHTHREEDYAPLKKDETVTVDIEIFPCAARVRAGWRLRLDVTPQEEQPDIPGYNPAPVRLWYGEEHEEGVNTVHIGSGLENFISCPVVPFKIGNRQML